MSPVTKQGSKDETRLGDQAAAQPLSGTNLVATMGFRGFFGGTNFAARIEETKKKAG